MDRGTFRIFVVALAVIVVAVAVAAAVFGGTAGDPAAAQGEQAVGIVSSIDSEGLTNVRGFTILTPDGRSSSSASARSRTVPSSRRATSPSTRPWRRRSESGTRRRVASLVAFRLEDAP